ncbi:hypothetical protein COCOBI_06-5430 [Coccomyxa sp. Obi]|nr:hypothetical protein COCOBI_06-5430 [Coccomyxa sp. Obi]
MDDVPDARTHGRGKHKAFGSMGLGMTLTTKPNLHMGPQSGPAQLQASASRRIRSSRHPRSLKTDACAEVIESLETERGTDHHADQCAPSGKQPEEDHSYSDLLQWEANTHCPTCNRVFQHDISMRRRLGRLRQLTVPGQLFIPDKLVVGGCALLVTLLTRTLLRWFLRRVRKGPRKARPPLPAPAMAPDESRGEERHVMAARRQLFTQPRSTSGTKRAPPKQTVGGKITDPLWQYAALAVYPERLRGRRAAA